MKKSNMEENAVVYWLILTFTFTAFLFSNPEIL